MILLVIAGDTPASNKLTLLFERYNTILLKYAYQITGSQQDSEDCVAETFVTIWNILHDSPLKIGDVEARKTGNFLITIAKNKALNIQRRKSHISIEEYIEPLDSPLEDPIINILDSNETRATLVQLLGKMDEQKSTPLILRYYHDCSVKEIAQIMSITENYVSVLMRRGRIELKEALLDYAE